MTALERLKREAEEQMRRQAPSLAGGSQQQPHKKARLDSHDVKLAVGEGDEATEVDRFEYAAPDALVNGATCFLATCGFRRERSATKDALQLLRPHLPVGARLKLSKVGCRGVAVIQVDGIDPVAVVGAVLADVASGRVKRPMFLQRVTPGQATCLLAPDALQAAAAQLCSSYLHAHGSAGPAAGQHSAPAIVEFAVLFKGRGHDVAAAAADRPGAAPGAGPATTSALAQRGADTAAASPGAVGVAAPRAASEAGAEAEAASAVEAAAARAVVGSGAGAAAGMAGAGSAGVGQGAQVSGGSTSPDGPAIASQPSTAQQPLSQPTLPAAPEAAEEAVQQPVQQPALQAGLGGEAAASPVQGMERSRVIQVLAAAMQEACASQGLEAKVNLSAPQVVLVAEVVPLPKQQLVCVLATVPASMVVLKPKLLLKPVGGA